MVIDATACFAITIDPIGVGETADEHEDNCSDEPRWPTGAR